MLGYLSLDIIRSTKLTVFLKLHSWKTVRFSEQIISADKYPSIFSPQMEAIVYFWWYSYSVFFSAQWVGVSLMALGKIVELCVSVVTIVNYCAQCELLIFYLREISLRMEEKTKDLNIIMKVMGLFVTFLYLGKLFTETQFGILPFCVHGQTLLPFIFRCILPFSWF